MRKSPPSNIKVQTTAAPNSRPRPVAISIYELRTQYARVPVSGRVDHNHTGRRLKERYCGSEYADAVVARAMPKTTCVVAAYVVTLETPDRTA